MRPAPALASALLHADGLLLTLCQPSLVRSRACSLPRYVPYGPVQEVMPYLMRRAQENADALSGAAEQRGLMLREVGRRLFG